MHVHAWVLDTPQACASAFEAGSKSFAEFADSSDCAGPSVMHLARKPLSSASRNNHQEPTMMAFRGDSGPPTDQAARVPGKSPKRSKGSAKDRNGGPRPRSHDRLASRRARSICEESSQPALSEFTR